MQLEGLQEMEEVSSLVGLRRWRSCWLMLQVAVVLSCGWELGDLEA